MSQDKDSNKNQADNRPLRDFVYGSSSSLPLPFYQKVNLPTPPNEIPFWPAIVPESCASKIVIGGFSGYVMGLGLGVFMGAMGDSSSIQIINGREVPQAPLREQMRSAMRATGAKSLGMGKTFGTLTALIGGVECVIEKYRAKHDAWNAVLSGCAVGGSLAAKSGPAV
jgi:mitochondrial import inner membrane translocase subunit TIM22